MVPPSRRLRIAPSLLSADFADLAGAIAAAEAAGVDAFHLDVMDGHFVPNISFGPALVRAVRARTKLPLDVHLMVEHPGKYVEAFAKAGGDTLVFHIEANADPASLIPAIKKLDRAVGIALRPETPAARVDPWVGQLDQVMVMSVHPGFSGQSYIPETLPKVGEVRRKLEANSSSADISVDGGITVENVGGTARAGATFFVCGNSVYGTGSVAANVAAIRRAITDGDAHAVR